MFTSEPNPINLYLPERISSVQLFNQRDDDDSNDRNYEPSTDLELESFDSWSEGEEAAMDEAFVRQHPIPREQSPPYRQPALASSLDTSGHCERPQWFVLKHSRSEMIGCRDWRKTSAPEEIDLKSRLLQNNSESRLNSLIAESRDSGQHISMEPPSAPTTRNPESIATRKVENVELMIIDSPKASAAQESVAPETMHDDVESLDSKRVRLCDSRDAHDQLSCSGLLPIEWFLGPGNSNLGCKMNKSIETGYVKRKSKNPFIEFFLSMYSRRPKKRAADVARQAGRLWRRMSDRQRSKYISAVTDGLLHSAKPRQP